MPDVSHHDTELIAAAAQSIRDLRRHGCRVHSITNTVAQNFTANVLLACGARPSMTVDADEVEYFTSRANALHINLGTLDSGRRAAIEKSIEVANQAGKPILLDPVMVHVSPNRRDFARELSSSVHVIRANQAEMDSLGDSPASAVSVVTGPVDHVNWEDGSFTIERGSHLMDQVIATGCALGGLMAALLPVAPNPQTAAIAALGWFAFSGENAHRDSQGPGTFAPLFLDRLYDFDPVRMEELAR